MSQDGMSRLEGIVRAVVTGPDGGSDSSMTVLAAELRTRPESRHRAPDAVDDSMRGLVSEVLRAHGFRNQWPGLVPVARGIVDLVPRRGVRRTGGLTMRATHAGPWSHPGLRICARSAVPPAPVPESGRTRWA